MLTLSLTVVFIFNFEHVSHIQKTWNKPKYEPYTGKKKKSNNFNWLQIELFLLRNISPLPPYISPPPPSNIGPSNLYFVSIYTQGVLKGFYGISINYYVSIEKKPCMRQVLLVVSFIYHLSFSKYIKIIFNCFKRFR